MFQDLERVRFMTRWYIGGSKIETHEEKVYRKKVYELMKYEETIL